MVGFLPDERCDWRTGGLPDSSFWTRVSLGSGGHFSGKPKSSVTFCLSGLFRKRVPASKSPEFSVPFRRFVDQ